ncbi:MAG: sodium:solute symporter [Cytophagaceae bacterium]|jgi:SSS family solute:Na+ symporter|nr:sodium:solute symporter [Cytophagaceae bacterium]
MDFQAIDILIVGIYILMVFGIGFYFSSKQQNVTDFFLAGRNLPWYVIGAAAFTTNISSEHYIGLAGSGYDQGFAVGNFELSACFLLILLAWIFAPHYLKTGIFTTPEFLEKRFNAACRWYFSVISILAYIVTKISVTLLAGGILMMQVMGWDLYTSCLLLVLATGIYTIAGGTQGIARAQLFQLLVMVAGGITLCYFGLQQAGSLSMVMDAIPEGHAQLFRPASHPEFPWPGMVFGTLVIGFWYWNTDQYIVQRALTAKDTQEVRRGILMTGFLKLLPLFILVFPGMIAKALYPEIHSSEVFSTLLFNTVPSGFKGLVVAALLAALMSSLASCFNTSSTLFTLDIYKKLYPNANEFVLVNVGRIATIVVIIFGIIWVPFISSISDHLFVYLQSTQAYLAPPIVVVFISGMFWSRATGKAAFRVLVIGALLGIVKFITEVTLSDGSENVLSWLAHLNFLYYSLAVFFVCAVLMVVFSLRDTAPDPASIQPYLFQFKSLAHAQDHRWISDLIGTVVLLFIVFSIWFILN